MGRWRKDAFFCRCLVLGSSSPNPNPKQPSRRAFVTTNLIGITDVPSQTEPPSFTAPPSLQAPTPTGNYTLQNSTQFHNVPCLQQQHSSKAPSYAYEVKRILAKKLYVPSASEIANYHYCTSCYYWCLKELARAESNSGVSSSDISTYQYLSWNSMRKAGLAIVNKRLDQFPESAPQIAEEMYLMLQKNKKIKTVLHIPHRTVYHCKGPSREMITTRNGKQRRKRLEWSEAEEAIFEAGIIGEKTAREIADALFIRTPEDVRLHVRAENEKRAKHVPPLPPLKLAREIRKGRKRNINQSENAKSSITDAISESHSESESDTSEESGEKSFGIMDSDSPSSVDSSTGSDD